MSLEVSIARLETKLDSVLEKLEAQEHHNERFYETRSDVKAILSNAKGAKWAFGLFGALTIAVSSLVAWVVTTFKG